MQSDSRLIQDIAHPPQIGAELRRQADTLCLPATEGGSCPVEVEVAQSDLLQKAESGFQLLDGVSGYLGTASCGPVVLEKGAGLLNGHAVKTGDGMLLELYRQGFRPQAGSAAFGTGVRFQGICLYLGVFFSLQPGTVTDGTPAVVGIVGKEARVKLGEAAPAARTCPFGGKNLRGVGLLGVQNMHTVLAQLQGQREAVSQLLLAGRFDQNLINRHLNCMFLVAVEPGPIVRRQQLAVYPQMAVSLAGGPGSQVGIVALAGQYEGGRNLDPLAAVVTEYVLYNLVNPLRLNRHAAIGAVLHTQTQKQEPDEMVQLGYSCHRALPAPAAGTLLNCNGRRNTGHAVHLRTGGRLDELTGICVQRLQIAPLPLIEKDIKGNGALSAAADPGNYGEGVQWNGQINILEIVLAGSAEGDVFLSRSSTFFRGQGGACSFRGESFGNVALQRRSGVAALDCRYLIGPAGKDKLSAGLSAFWAEIDDPVTGPQYIEVVFDNYQRVSGLNKLAKRLQQGCDIVEMQPGGRFVEQEQNSSGFFTAVCVGYRQMSGQFQALRLAATEGRQGLSQAQVAQPDISQGFQLVQHLLF